MNSSSASDSRAAGSRVVAIGIVSIVVILGLTAILLFLNLPDANAFNARVEQLFVENDDLTSNAEIKLAKKAIKSTLRWQRMFRIPRRPAIRIARIIISTHVPLARQQRSVAAFAQRLCNRHTIIAQIPLIRWQLQIPDHMADTCLMRIQSR